MWRIDNRDVLKWAATYTGPKFHAMLRDPPYHLTQPNIRNSYNPTPGLSSWDAVDEARKQARADKNANGFMGKQWDGGDIAFRPETWAALAQHLHPGAFIMAFAGTRGYHRMACAMEDAGLIIHPAIGWAFGQGFPKATRIDTQVDKAAGAERETAQSVYASRRPRDGNGATIHMPAAGGETAPATPLARAWAGHRYGLQALKPAFEFIAVAQVPYRGKPVDCITGTGAGALWVDGGRIGTGAKKWETPRGGIWATDSEANAALIDNPQGRWPANLILSHSPACGETCADDCAVRMVGEQSGDARSAYVNAETARRNAGKECDTSDSIVNYGGNMSGLSYTDTGTAARFFFNADHTLERIEAADPLFYCAKAGRGERDAGLPDGQRSSHPTVKPLKLTQHLATLLQPPTEYAPRRLLVPFSGSGSEMTGALLAGWEEVQGVELEAEYAAIAAARLEYWTKHAGELATVTAQDKAEEVTNWPKRETVQAQPALF